MSKSYVVATFANGDFEGIDAHQTEECADAFADGVRSGADIFGSSCNTYVLPRDTTDMRADERTSQFEAAMEAYAEHVENQRLAAEHD